jgi:hypothetical protein
VKEKALAFAIDGPVMEKGKYVVVPYNFELPVASSGVSLVSWLEILMVKDLGGSLPAAVRILILPDSTNCPAIVVVVDSFGKAVLDLKGYVAENYVVHSSGKNLIRPTE